MRAGLAGPLALILPPLLWAGNAVMARGLVGEFPPMALSFWRWTLAMGLLLPFAAMALHRQRDFLRRDWKALAVLGVLGVGCYNSLQYQALQTSSAINVTLLAASIPAVTLLLGASLFGRRVAGRDLMAVGLSALGVLWVVTRGSPDQIAHMHFTPGDLWMGLAVTTWALYTQLLQRIKPPLDAIAFQAAHGVMGWLFTLPLFAAETWVLQQHTDWSWRTLGAVLYVALGPSLLAFFCWDRSVRNYGPELPSQVANTMPLFAALLSVVFLGESLHGYHLIGAALIGTAIILSQARKAASKP